MDIKFVILIICSLVSNSMGQLRCYACSFSSADSDQSCLTITENTHSVDCPYRYCTILRQEFLDPPGQISSFLRGCEDDPAYLNHELSDASFRYFYRACTSDLCNIGNGIQTVVGGQLSPTPDYDGGNLLVPGTGNTATLKISYLLVLFAYFVVLLL